MENQHLISGEEILMQSGNETITLTNFRLRYYESKMGDARLISFQLDKLSAIEMNYKSHPFFLYFGVAAIIGGIAVGASGGKPEALSLFIILGIILILVYYFTRSHAVSITSDSGVKINYQTKGMKTEDHINFINKIETAKHSFVAETK
jgi:hypothetical protein